MSVDFSLGQGLFSSPFSAVHEIASVLLESGHIVI